AFGVGGRNCWCGEDHPANGASATGSYYLFRGAEPQYRIQGIAVLPATWTVRMGVAFCSTAARSHQFIRRGRGERLHDRGGIRKAGLLTWLAGCRAPRVHTVRQE